MPDSPKDKITLIFIGNFFTGPKAWAPLLSLFEKDTALTERFAAVEFTFHPDLPLKELGKKLGDSINRDYHQKPVYLVCHGLGVFIAFKFLFAALNDQQGKACRNIKRIILFSPPIPENKIRKGFRQKLIRLRFFLLRFLFNPTYRILKLATELQPEILKLKNYIYERVVDTRFNTESSVMIPMFAIYGSRDRLINPIALKSFIGENQVEVDGDHLSVIKPENTQNEVWVAFKNALLYPLGHKNIIEVEHFYLKAALKPLVAAAPKAGKGRQEHKTVLEQVGDVQYEITFSQRNISKNRFPIKFSDSAKGHIRQLFANYKNEAESQDLGRFSRLSNYFEAQLNPKERNDTYKLVLEANNGFNAQHSVRAGQEEAMPDSNETEFFLPLLLGQGERHYQTIEINLDLSGFIRNSYLVQDIQVYWLPVEISIVQNYQALLKEVQYHTGQLTQPYENTAPGQYKICAEAVNCGMMIVFWQIAAPV